ncbi:hypothetical protein MZM54_01990 [[Brevibacterium] frigoritolerans]|nr:hypothetical protein [Peribacillus frigoritolerans]
MKKHKTIYIYSAFPLLDIGTYFSKKAIRPMVYRQNLDKITYLPKNSGFPKSFLLKIEHELSLNTEVCIFSSFLNENDYEPIRTIASKYQAEMEFVFLETTMQKLYEKYLLKNGEMSFEGFCTAYQNFFHFPYLDIKALSFEQVT